MNHSPSSKSCLNKGCTGTKLCVQLFNEMRRRKQKHWVIMMCVRTGQGAACVF